MQSDDLFAARFRAETERLARWADGWRDCADVEHERQASFWRLRMVPQAGAACPLELILHSEAQTFDLDVGGEGYEGLPIGPFDDIAPLMDGIVAGRVVRRHWSTAASGRLLAVETEISLGDGRAWTRRRTLSGAAGEVIAREHHWSPYRRGA